MRLAQSPLHGIVSNVAFQPEKVVYDKNYQNEQGCSAVFTRHLDQVAGIIEKHGAGKTVLEVGCGKGTFTEMLHTRNMAITGLDPAYEGNAPYIIREHFSPALGVTGDVIVLRHVLEHIALPFEFLKQIATANGGKGLIYIEVPCLDWIMENHAWFDIFYEHVNYFRLSDFNRFFGKIIDSGRFFGGQYIFVVADIASLGLNDSVNSEVFSTPSDFFSGIDDAIDIITKTPGRLHVVWGAASKGVLFSLHLHRRGHIPDFAIDINPAKQNRYLPATGLHVLSPESAFERLRPGDVIFVMNPNYLDEIRSQSGTKYQYVLP
ncbi:class I SAM-dependent methyltransferase [Desulfosudis oleivorans]|nr:class I SAM-dependent methyltransferase [Desulfosudis oleivorans]